MNISKVKNVDWIVILLTFVSSKCILFLFCYDLVFVIDVKLFLLIFLYVHCLKLGVVIDKKILTAFYIYLKEKDFFFLNIMS